jgi:hypothetical protein
VRPGPYGFDATGPAAVLVPLLAPWVDGRLTARGTQFLVDGGFDVEAEFATQRAAAELAARTSSSSGPPTRRSRRGRSPTSPSPTTR